MHKGHGDTGIRTANPLKKKKTYDKLLILGVDCDSSRIELLLQHGVQNDLLLVLDFAALHFGKTLLLALYFLQRAGVGLREVASNSIEHYVSNAN